MAVVVLVALVALVVGLPLRSEAEPEDPSVEDRRAALEAAKEQKYREIRDAELDFRTGKTDDSDFRATDRELRAEAIAILRQLDELEKDGR